MVPSRYRCAMLQVVVWSRVIILLVSYCNTDRQATSNYVETFPPDEELGELFHTWHSTLLKHPSQFDPENGPLGPNTIPSQR